MKTALLASAVVGLITTQRAYSGELETLSKEAVRNRSSEGGYQYETKFLNAIDPTLRAAMDACCKNTPDTKDGHPAEIVFVVAADGRVRKLLYSTDIPFGKCIGERLRAISHVPKPPHDSWAIALAVANHSNAKILPGPSDKPARGLGQASMDAYDKAIAPYVAKSRATYPSAKKRFLNGLPTGYRFSVRVRLIDRDKLKREDSFVSVRSIKNGQITGVIASELGAVKDYKTREQITFPESKIDNWVILRPDGTEEGNYVGKFLDHYKPQ